MPTTFAHKDGGVYTLVVVAEWNVANVNCQRQIELIVIEKERVFLPWCLFIII